MSSVVARCFARSPIATPRAASASNGCRHRCRSNQCTSHDLLQVPPQPCGAYTQSRVPDCWAETMWTSYWVARAIVDLSTRRSSCNVVWCAITIAACTICWRSSVDERPARVAGHGRWPFSIATRRHSVAAPWLLHFGCWQRHIVCARCSTYALANTIWSMRMELKCNYACWRATSILILTRGLWTAMSHCCGNHPNPLSNPNQDIKLCLLPLCSLPKAVNATTWIGYSCLPRPYQPLPKNLECTVIGWGKRRNRDAIGTSVLHQAEVPIIPMENCRRVYHDTTITKVPLIYIHIHQLHC